MRAVMAEYSRLLPICHGFLARPVTYYLKWCANRTIRLLARTCGLRASRPASVAATANTVWRFAMASIKSNIRRMGCAATAAALLLYPEISRADENGISFWIPGLFGSLAATPQQPGWSLATIYYHTSVSAGADVARAREFELGRVPGNVTLNTNLNLNVNATGNLGFVIPSYVFETPVLGGQASVSLVGAYGVVGTSLAGTLSGVLTTPFGGTIP